MDIPPIIIEQPTASPETDLPNHGVFVDLTTTKSEIDLLKLRVTTLETR